MTHLTAHHITPKILLRTAAALMLFHDVGHTVGALTWRQTTDPVKQEVIQQLTDHAFPFMGAVHSMGDAFDGYGYAMILALFLIAAILWIVSDVTERDVFLTKKILVLVSAILLAWGVVELIFFFPLAASFTLMALLLTVGAVVQIGKQMRDSSEI